MLHGIDTATMTLKAQMNRNDSTGFGDVSVALPVGTDLWLGDFDGQDIAIEPNQLSTAAQPRKEPRCRLKKHYAKLPRRAERAWWSAAKVQV